MEKILVGLLLSCLLSHATAEPAATTPAPTPAPAATNATPATAPTPATPIPAQLPNFQAIDLDDYCWNVNMMLQNFANVISNTIQQPPTWNNSFQPLEEHIHKIKSAWNLLIILNNVAPTDQTTATLNALLPKIAEFHGNLMQNKELYKTFVTMQKSKEFAKLTPTQQVTINQTVQDYQLNGVGLNAQQNQRFLEIIQRLRELGLQYSSNLQNATNAWQLYIAPQDQNKLDGIPDSIKQQAAAKAKSINKDGWLLTLDSNCLVGVESYAKNRDLRETLYKAFINLGTGKWDNTSIVGETLQLRKELAALLGYPNYAAYANADRQPPDPTQALQFLEELATKLKPSATKDFSQLQMFAKQDNVTDLQAWDIAYYAEWYKAAIAKDSQTKSMEYFQTKTVLQGLFNLVSILFNVDFTEITGASVWDPSVKLYCITDVLKQPIAYVYLDLYARDGKMSADRVQMYTTRLQAQNPILPVAVMSTSLKANSLDLITHESVVRLFTEFGEVLQRSLMQLDYPGFSSTTGMTWDSLALSSQFMQYWAWQREFILDMAVHYKTGAKMPEDLFRTLTAAHNVDAALNLLQQIQMAIFDLRIHLNASNNKGMTALDIFNEVRKQYEVLPTIENDNLPNRFSETFTTDYAATYYSYYWDKSLAADSFSAFIENGIFSAKIGHKFRDTMLQQGGQASVLDLFKKFRNKEPEYKYLLSLNNINH